jgi:hypothetical protein
MAGLSACDQVSLQCQLHQPHGVVSVELTIRNFHAPTASQVKRNELNYHDASSNASNYSEVKAP